MNKDVNCFTALDLRYAKGRAKKWALEEVIKDCLYSTEPKYARYLKFEDLTKLPKCDEENEEEYIFKFGYQYRIPRTEIDLHVLKKSGLIYMAKVNENFGLGWDEVEDKIVEFVLTQQKLGNLYYQTSLNFDCYKI